MRTTKSNSDNAVKIRTGYSAPVPVRVHFADTVSMTRQAHKDECDINNIMKRAERTGLADYVNAHQAQYGDVSSLDFQTAMQTIAEARELFEAMPAKQRDHFNNDPAQFLDFVQDPANREKAIEIGLMTDERIEEPAHDRRMADKEAARTRAAIKEAAKAAQNPA
jgi:phage internal scaffolding protein